MSTVRIPDKRWSKIVAFLRTFAGIYVGNEAECRRFVEGVLWITRSGAQWRLLPAEYGNWNSVYKRFARWCDAGVWEAMHHHFAANPDMENVILDTRSFAPTQPQPVPRPKKGPSGASPRPQSSLQHRIAYAWETRYLR